MDVLAELLPPSYLNKTENAAKDRKQQPQSRQSAKALKAFAEQETDVAIQHLPENNESWQGEERRSGDDRRQQEKARGRWLESRAEKDRRQVRQAIQIKI